MVTKLIKTASGMEVEQDGKSYPVRSEDEEGFRELAWIRFCLNPIFEPDNGDGFIKALSQGIEISSERVKIKIDRCKHGYAIDPLKGCGISNNCGCPQYATLLTEDKEGEGQEDAVEFAEWISDNGWVKKNRTHPNKVGQYYSYQVGYRTIQELYEIFKSTLPTEDNT